MELSRLKQEWDALQPLLPERDALLRRKLRMEWNYHSNHIEGNTLTYGETELLLLHDRTTGKHLHREYLEMKAHDVAIDHVTALAVDPDRLLTEADIRDLNKIILKEPFWKAAETPDGLVTRKEIIPGQYKTSPNNVRLANGEIFYFASVEDTAPKMQALATWLRRELESPTLPPVTLAARLHHDFVLIHPFDDGNGRVARLLVNYVLMRAGFLPLIVRTGDKANYLTALQLADAGDLQPLTEYMEALTGWSLRLGIKAAKGESISEPGDVEKEVELFVRHQMDLGLRMNRHAWVTPETVQTLFDLSLKPFLLEVETRLAQLRPLFSRHDVNMMLDQSGPHSGPGIAFFGDTKVDLKYPAVFNFNFYGYQYAVATPFDFNVQVRIDFTADHYRIDCSGETKNPYSHLMSGEESEKLAAGILATALAGIKILAAQP